jgi:CRP-like cAMP-binding protein
MPPDDIAGLAGDLEIITLRAKQSTQSAGIAMNHVDFPIDAVLSVIATLKSGETVEVGTVGCESFVESDAALDSTFASRAAFCQVEGRVGRMTIECFEERMAASSGFARAVRHNVRAALFSSQQFAVCNLKHTVFQRSARWLAMTEDRVGRSTFTLSREFLAIMLGSTADGVSEATDRLDQLGSIRYAGNAVEVRDGTILRGIACECYEVSKAAFTASLLA